MSKNIKIFVQIPSYRETQLIATIADMVLNAHYPASLNIVVCWQHGDDEELSHFLQEGFQLESSTNESDFWIHRLSFHHSDVLLIDVNYKNTLGCGWARSKIQEYYSNEKYSLQLDAHHRFVRHWDNVLIEMLEGARLISPKPVISGYPPPFNPQGYPVTRQEQLGLVVIRRFAPPGVVELSGRIVEYLTEKDCPVRARFLSGGFIFADGQFVLEVPNDPEQFFSTEEIALTVRAFTRGYDFYHPHRLVLWHQYNRDGPSIWSDNSEDAERRAEPVINIKEVTVHSYLKTLALLGMLEDKAPDFGKYGLGTYRTIKQYERYAGISFKHKGIRRALLDMAEPSNDDFSLSDDEWISGLVCQRLIEVRCDINEFQKDRGDLVSAEIIIFSGEDWVSFVLPLESLQRDTSEFECVLDFESSPYFIPDSFSVRTQTVSGKSICVAGNVREGATKGYFKYPWMAEK